MAVAAADIAKQHLHKTQRAEEKILSPFSFLSPSTRVPDPSLLRRVGYPRYARTVLLSSSKPLKINPLQKISPKTQIKSPVKPQNNPTPTK
jgi:hypothetical protein